ncbi:hypothetical protein C8R43DRAFT_1117968 [Mycena crocata]|nr:hypothetical protein C8R43DRAFT_1117968 [Mycena crocata]
MDLKLLSDTPPDLPGAIICMQSRVSSLLIGVDQYKTGSIWNLESCVDDAQNVQRGLLEDLKVHICMLLDRQATKENIETCFLTHLLQNAKIAHGDAISIYFAGHGSTIRAPIDWFHSGSVAGTAEVLCTYDFGYRKSGRDIRSFFAWHAPRSLEGEGR